MSDYYFSVNLGNDRTLCLAPLTERKRAYSGEEIDDASGYFLFETRGSDETAVEIIARVQSEEAALKLRDMLNMA